MEYFVHFPGADKGFANNPGKDWVTAGLNLKKLDSVKVSEPSSSSEPAHSPVTGKTAASEPTELPASEPAPQPMPKKKEAVTQK